MRGKINPPYFLFGAFLFALFGLFMFPWMLWNENAIKVMAAWPTAQAEIIATDTEYRSVRYSEGRYRHKITYRFSMGEQPYTGDRFSYGGPAPYWPSREQAAHELPKVDSNIPIHYNPENPSDSVIHVFQRPDSETRLYQIFALAMGIGGLLIMVFPGIVRHRN